jgi:putative PIN family toxin of toxin-antitoxin system
MISAVYDCNVYFQAFVGRGPAKAIMSLAEEKVVALFVSPTIAEESRSVLLRPCFQRKYPTITEERVAEYFVRIAEFATTVVDVPAAYSLERDPSDEPYLNLAIATQASFLVSRDKDLLSLMDNAEFRAAYPGLTIIEPAAFLTHVRTAIARDLGYE